MKLFLMLSLFLISGYANAAHGIFPLKSRIFPQTLKATVNANATGATLQYYGGPVISNVKVITVFWGNGVDNEIQSKIGQFYTSLVSSTHMDWLNQYNTNTTAVDGRQGTNQTIGKGSYGGSVTITPSHTSKDLEDRDIQAELEYQVSAKKLPTPDNNTLFMIYFPGGYSITIDGQKSCQAFCAYHMGFESKSYGNMFYGVMPDLRSGGCSFGCGMGSSVFASNTAISSHELVEAVTDPFPTPGDKPAFPQAWNSVKGEEIADLCAYGSATLNSPSGRYSLSQEWDNSTNRCAAGPFNSDR